MLTAPLFRAGADTARSPPFPKIEKDGSAREGETGFGAATPPALRSSSLTCRVTLPKTWPASEASSADRRKKPDIAFFSLELRFPLFSFSISLCSGSDFPGCICTFASKDLSSRSPPTSSPSPAPPPPRGARDGGCSLRNEHERGHSDHPIRERRCQLHREAGAV